jgi:tRNA threonylcarbamoyladenosine biosynthesis protein TsaB
MAASLALALDNSLDFLNMALALDGRLIEERHTLSVAHSSQILPLRVTAMLSEAGYEIRDVSLLIVTLGPGSFTGIRVGLSFCKGIASALGIPLIGVPTLDLLAAPFAFLEGYTICPLIDAKKGEVFLALYRPSKGRLSRVSDFVSARPDALKEILPGHCVCFGSGVRIGQEALAGLDDLLIIREGFQRVVGGTVIRAGLDLWEKGEAGDLNPLYGRRSEAEIKFNVTLS